MSLTTGNIPMHGWKRIKMQYVAAVCGIALVVAAAGFAASRDGASAPAPSIGAIPAAAGQTEPGMLRIVYYLVEDEVAKARLEAGIALDARAGAEIGAPEPPVTTHVLIAGTPEAEAEAMNLIYISDEEAAAAGTFTVEYVDMRLPKEPVD